MSKFSAVRRLYFTLAFAALVVLNVAPAQAVETSLQHFYYTSLVEMLGSAFPTTGEMELRLEPGGIVRGYYNPSTGAGHLPVSGGLDGIHIWLDVPAAGRLHIVGTLARNGAITGQAWYGTSNAIFSFRARPELAP